MNGLAEKLASGVAEMELQVSAETQHKLLAYVALLHKWNRVYNLTAVRDPAEMITLHLLDSLSVLPYINCDNLLDVGSGGGLPGIVLAICMPELKVTTIDTVQKKAIFMRQVKGELGLNNLEVMHARVENFVPAQKFDVVISRAFSELGLLVKLTQHLLKDTGRWFAMKGVSPDRELKSLNVVKSDIYPLKVAGLDAERHLVVFGKQ